MARICERCGRRLPRGTDVCPDCAAARESEAALFTKMTSETETWQTAEPVKQKRRTARSRSSRRNLVMGGAILALVLVAGVLLLVFRPAARVTRAIRAGEIQHAYEIYWSSASLSGDRVSSIDKAVMAAADKICTQFANHEIDADSAASKLSMLGGFGEGTADMLEDTYELFRTFNRSHEHMVNGEKLLADGDYLAAREEFLQVEELDAKYEAAQARVSDCLTRYGREVAARAEEQMEEKDFPAAIDTLKKGNSTLFDLGTFSEAIDSTLLRCYDDYAAYLLSEAAARAEDEDFDAAVELLETGAADFPVARDDLDEALEQYELQARAKHLADAHDQADELYEQGDYAEAFAILEEIHDRAEEYEEGADRLIEELEARYAEELCARARERYAGERDRLPAAIAILDEALEIRDLEPIRACREDLAQYLPLSLVTAEYATKDGVVFRSDGAFESLDGTKFTGGWLWGENDGWIDFDLNGAYDVFECVFATRRADNANANGRFELWCDGEKVYTADKLYHWQKEARSITVDVTDCQVLRIVFLCDYTVSTAENGYCYHGICDPTLTKDLPTE